MTQQLSFEETVCLERCCSYIQYHYMRSHFEARTCPFCDIDRSRNKVLFENIDWLLLDNAFPDHINCDTQLILVSRWHIRNPWEISMHGWVGLHEVFQWIEKRFTCVGGMLFMRFGDMRYNAGTVPHLHINLWVPNGTGEVRVPIYKTIADQDRNCARAQEFSDRYEAGDSPNPDE